VVLGLALCGAWQLVPEDVPIVDVNYLSDVTTCPDGVVGFPNWNASTAKEVMSCGANSVHQSSGGLLVLPPDASAYEPVPVSVILYRTNSAQTNTTNEIAPKKTKGPVFNQWSKR